MNLVTLGTKCSSLSQCPSPKLVNCSHTCTIKAITPHSEAAILSFSLVVFLSFFLSLAHSPFFSLPSPFFSDLFPLILRLTQTTLSPHSASTVRPVTLAALFSLRSHVRFISEHPPDFPSHWTIYICSPGLSVVFIIPIIPCNFPSQYLQ